MTRSNCLIGKEMYPNKFPSKTPFNYKRLNKKEIIQFNQQIIIESEWVIDLSGKKINHILLIFN